MFKLRTEIRMLKRQMDSIEAELLQDKCSHKGIVFEEPSSVSVKTGHVEYVSPYPKYYGQKKCLNCSKVIERYETELTYHIAWLEYMEQRVAEQRAKVEKLAMRKG